MTTTTIKKRVYADLKFYVVKVSSSEDGTSTWEAFFMGKCLGVSFDEYDVPEREDIHYFDTPDLAFEDAANILDMVRGLKGGRAEWRYHGDAVGGDRSEAKPQIVDHLSSVTDAEWARLEAQLQDPGARIAQLESALIEIVEDFRTAIPNSYGYSIAVSRAVETLKRLAVARETKQGSNRRNALTPLVGV